MIQVTTLIACLITLQNGVKTQDKPYVGPKPHPKVQILLDEGLKEGISWELSRKGGSEGAKVTGRPQRRIVAEMPHFRKYPVKI